MNPLTPELTIMAAAAGEVEFAINWLIQSTLLIIAGLLLARYLQRKGAAAQSLAMSSGGLDSTPFVDRVLADDPTMLKAFQAIDTIMTQRKDWKALERAYRKMINRLPADADPALRMMLWTNLAEIYRSRLNDFRAAAKAYEVAATADPAEAQGDRGLSGLDFTGFGLGGFLGFFVSCLRESRGHEGKHRHGDDRAPKVERRI